MSKLGAQAWIRNLIAAGIAASLLTACGEEAVRDAVSQDAVPVDAAAAVVPGNTGPVITGDPVLDATVAAQYVFQPSAQDNDGDPLTFSAQGLPGWATLDAGTGRVTGTPAETDAGETADIDLHVTDGKQVASLKTFRIRIGRGATHAPSVPGTQPPVISGTPALTATAGGAWSFTPTASDPDTLTLTFSIANKPSWASFSSATGKLSGTPTAAQVGSYAKIAISVSDGATTVTLPAFTLTVQAAANNAPTIAGSPSGTATVGAAYNFAPTAADADKQTLGFSITNKPSWASFSTTTGALTGTPGAGNVGAFSNIVISVSDGKAQSALPAFGITVQAAANGAPAISGQPATTARVGTPYTFTPTASDPNSDKLTFAVSGAPTWTAFDTATGKLSGTPATGNQGTFGNIVISVSDGKTSTSLAAFSILVSQPTVGSATLSWTPPTQNTDGTSLTNLGGYRIYYGATAGALTQSIQITNPGLTSYTVGNLSPGTYYFALAAYTTAGVEGTASAVGSKSIQ